VVLFDTNRGPSVIFLDVVDWTASSLVRLGPEMKVDRDGSAYGIIMGSMYRVLEKYDLILIGIGLP